MVKCERAAGRGAGSPPEREPPLEPEEEEKLFQSEPWSCPPLFLRRHPSPTLRGVASKEHALPRPRRRLTVDLGESWLLLRVQGVAGQGPGHAADVALLHALEQPRRGRLARAISLRATPRAGSGSSRSGRRWRRAGGAAAGRGDGGRRRRSRGGEGRRRRGGREQRGRERAAAGSRRGRERAAGRRERGFGFGAAGGVNEKLPSGGIFANTTALSNFFFFVSK
ncbi:hypothetical protein C2845_PM10G02990 [Panicum miliaceum]|uniref:Uncharacterized protein n=1 Tax=Panicum miliaceum TaxID=4540 RepID=A0A3L6PEP3_PANMI|nr:hypothetical protein C2845_PM10G02990 [Panicum miliaceum]